MRDRPQAIPRRLVLGGGAAAAVLPLRPARAAVQVSPVLLDLQAGQTTTTLQVVNRAAEASSLQIRCFAWAQSPDTDDGLEPTQDLVASPPVFTLASGETQIVRIVLRRPAQATERAFRLLVDEIPRPGAPGSLSFSMRLSLPLFAAPPARIAPDLAWAVRTDGAGPELVCQNRGSRRSRATELALTVGGARRLPLTLASSNAWIIAGGQRRWRIEDAARSLRPGTQLRLTGQLETGPLDASLVVG